MSENEITVERYEPSQREMWDDQVRSARSRHFMFERAYMDYHQDHFTDASLFVLLKGRPIAVLPASRRGEIVTSHGGLTFGGLLSGSELTTLRAVSAVQEAAKLYRSEGAQRLIYKPMPFIYRTIPADEDLFALFSSGANLIAREVTSAIGPTDRVRYSQLRRRGIQRATKYGLEVLESNRIREFVELLASVLAERHSTKPVHSAEEIELLKARFPNQIRLFVAVEKDDIVAGTLVFETSSVAHTQYIAANDRGREISALDVLFHYLISHTYVGRWFDFGISNERGGELNEGLIRHKEGFGARTVVHDRYLLDLD